MKVIILHLFLLLTLAFSHSLPEPIYSSTPEQHARTVHALDRYIKTIEADPDVRAKAAPLYQIHPPGVKTHGTVILWHGGFGMPDNLKLFGRYLFENNFNVFLPPLAGHALNGTRWPYSLLRDNMGGKAAREVLMSHPQIMNISKAITAGELIAPVHAPDGFDMDVMVNRVLDLLEKNLSTEDYNNVIKAFQLLVREDYYPGLEKDLFKYFESDHFRYDSTAYEQVSLVIPLPGPIYAGGFSMGGLQTMFAAARSKIIDRAVLLAPFFEAAAPEGKPSYRYLLEAVGVLDVYSAPVAGDVPIPSRILPAVDIVGRLAMQDDITRNVREHTATFCVYAEDDGVADYEIGINVCKSALRNNESIVYSYPASKGINHFVASGNFNKYSTAMAKEILRFFATGSAHVEELTTEMGDPELPDVPSFDDPFLVEGNEMMGSAEPLMMDDETMDHGSMDHGLIDHSTMSHDSMGHSM